MKLKKNNKKTQTYLIKYEKKSIGLEKFPIWNSAAVRLASVTQAFYWTLTKSNSCFRRVYFSSIICHSLEFHKWTWKLSIDVNMNVCLWRYWSLNKKLKFLHIVSYPLNVLRCFIIVSFKIKSTMLT